MVKNTSAMQEMDQAPGWEDPLEKEIATHSSIIACKVPGTAEPGGLNNSSSSQDPTFWSRLTQIPLYFILQHSPPWLCVLLYA